MQNEEIIKQLKNIPGVDKILLFPDIKKLSEKFDNEIIKYSINKTLEIIRNDIREDNKVWTKSNLIDMIKDTVKQLSNSSLKRVINATGIILHTNLGRAPLGKKVLKEITPIVEGYSNLEYDLNKGERGDRNDHITELIKFITKSEAALVVNNNAAAILLTLMTYAHNKEVIVSRGELIEIGGSFRLPDVMKASGAKMVEVGTTNRTKLSDYENAISEKTSIIFKAHKSNYFMSGYTKEVEISKLANLAREHNLIMVYDVGSGLLKQPDEITLSDEPDMRSLLQEGADIVCFSGDKLLGGPQAGIILGKEKYVSKLAKAPLFRALRVGKITISALSAVIRFYLSASKMNNNKMFKILDTPIEIIKQKAEKLQRLFGQNGIESDLRESIAKTGGGTVPAKDIKSYSVVLKNLSDKNQHEYIFAELLKQEIPVISVLKEGNIHFDVLTIEETDFNYMTKITKNILSNN